MVLWFTAFAGMTKPFGKSARTNTAGVSPGRLWIRNGSPDQAGSRCRSPAMRCIAFCSFSKARTSIWRTRSRLTL